MSTFIQLTDYTGIVYGEFTLPDGRELPELNWEDEGRQLHVWLKEIDRVMNNTTWGTFGARHQEWDTAWSNEFRRIRRAMGMFDPYSITW